MRRLLNRPRITLGELLVVALVALVGLAALRGGGALAAAVEFLALTIAIGVAVAAIVRGGASRIFAIGFFAATLGYGGMLTWYGANEFDPARGRMLATQAFAPLYGLVKRDEYFDVFRNQFATPEEEAELSRSQRFPPAALNLDQDYLGLTDSDRIVKTQYQFFRYDEFPSRREFMSAAHVLTALLLGYGAGKFALLAQRGRTRSAPPTSQASANDGERS